MEGIKIITSENEMKHEFYKEVRQRKEVNQKNLYLNQGIKNYYGYQLNKGHSTVLQGNYATFFDKNFSKIKNKKIAFISMGSGNSFREKILLEKMKLKNYNFSYFAVDSSKAALKLGAEKLKDIDIDKNFICADFGSEEFHKEIVQKLKGYDIRIYAFFGSTICNLETDYLADLMRDIMKKGDILWTDIAIRPNRTVLEDRKLFERYLEYLDDKKFRNFILYPIKSLNIPIDSGRLMVSMVEEDSLKALKFSILFKMKDEVSIIQNKTHLTLLPENYINCWDIRIFDANCLINFFEKRKFKLIDRDSVNVREQCFLEYQGD